MGYESKLITAPGTLLLDATADIDNVKQLCPWRQYSEVPQANYANLKIVHVPAHTKQYLNRYFKVASQRRAYVDWMITIITENMEPGQKGLVVCKKELFDNENIPNWPEGSEKRQDVKSYREQWGWDIGGRNLCAVHWGIGIGDNHWKDAEVVFLFDEHHLPMRFVIATAQGLQGHKATEGDLASMTTLNSKAATVAALQEGHLLRWNKQMALRGNGRTYDEHGACGHQKLVCSGDLRRLLASADSLFPGAEIRTLKSSSGLRSTDARALLELLSRPGLPPIITTRWVGQQMKKPWRNVSKHVMKLVTVRKAIENQGWTYVPGIGRRGGSFERQQGEPEAALNAVKPQLAA
jgi:hypothetical protein